MQNHKTGDGAPMAAFAGKIALVTGAASGIGRATAALFAERGATVWAADRDLAGCESLAAEIGDAIIPAALDVTDDAAFASVIAQITARHGGLDILFNNAGGPGSSDGIAAIGADAWDSTMALLLRSVALGTHHAVPAMIARGGGAIVNTASVAAFSAGNAPIAYSVAKAGVLHFTKCAAAELARHNIRVNAVCPGLILTGIFTQTWRDQAPALAQDLNDYMERIAPKAQPVTKPGLPGDIARAVAFLSSDDAAFVTGTHLLVDGGLLVGGRHSWDPDHQRPADHPLARHTAGASKEDVN